MITAMIITTRDDLVYSHAGPSGEGKYSGWINMPNGRPVLNTTPIFDSPQLAEKHMTDLRNTLKEKLKSDGVIE